MLLSWRHSDRTGVGVVEPRNVSRRNRRAWWARFTFNGITRYERGTYDEVGGEELSDAERDELRWLRNRTIQQRTADVFVQNTTDQRLIRNAFLQGFDT